MHVERLNQATARKRKNQASEVEELSKGLGLMANLEASAEGPSAGTPSQGPPIVSAVQLDAATMQAIISGVAAHFQKSRERDSADNGGELFFSK